MDKNSSSKHMTSLKIMSGVKGLLMCFESNPLDTLCIIKSILESIL